MAEQTDLVSLEKKVNRKTARKMRRNEISKISETLKDVKLDDKTSHVAKVEPIVSMEVCNEENRKKLLFVLNFILILA